MFDTCFYERESLSVSVYGPAYCVMATVSVSGRLLVLCVTRPSSAESTWELKGGGFCQRQLLQIWPRSSQQGVNKIARATWMGEDVTLLRL